jgi:hypothetical protein
VASPSAHEIKPSGTLEKLGTQIGEEGALTAAVELDGALELDDGGGVALGDGGVKLLERLVVVGDVGGVVLLVVQAHDLTGDGRLQRAEVVGEVGERDRRRHTPRRGQGPCAAAERQGQGLLRRQCAERHGVLSLSPSDACVV